MKVETTSLTISYPKLADDFFFGKTTWHTAVENISLSLSFGDWLVVAGESGSGKSSLGKGLVGLSRISSGKIWWMENDFSVASKKQWRQLRKKVFYQFPEPKDTFQPTLTMGKSIFHFTKSELNFTHYDQFLEWLTPELAQLELEKNHLSKYPKELSGGQLARFSFLRSMLINPEALILDEPLAGLDKQTQNLLLERLEKWFTSGKKLCILISHQPEALRPLATQVLILKEKTVDCYRRVNDLFLTPLPDYSEKLLKEWNISGR